MTKEEAKKILACRGNGYSEEDFNDAIEVAFNCIPSIPSDLDEAADDMRDDAAYDWVMSNFGNPKESLFDFDCRCFKAGAEWMAGQGVSMLGRVGIYGVDVESITKELREAGFNLGEEIILQIRKKQ